jgi:alanine-synthesizing transaminase
MFSSKINFSHRSNRLLLLLEEKKHAGIDIIDLTQSNPSQAGLQPDAEKVRTALSHPDIMQYEPSPKGLPEARVAVCEYYRSLGIEKDPETIFLTSSTSEAYSCLFKLLANPGDEFMVPAPSYPLFESLALLDSVKLVSYPLTYDANKGWRVNFETLEARISTRTRGVMAVNPNNPTGSFLSADELLQFDSLCAAHDMAFIVDEVFLNYSAASNPSPIISAVGNKALTFTLSGLSKPLCLPQVKLGWICVSGNPDLMSEASEKLEYILDAYLGVNAMVQLGAAQLLKTGPSIQNKVLQRIKQNEDLLKDKFLGQKKISLLLREGGWYAILYLGDHVSDEDFALNLLEKTNVNVHPGYYYDFREDGYLVISLICQPEEFLQGIERILKFVENI